MPFFKSVVLVSGTVAGLCALALPMWALGVPGVENQYAKGWKMGLSVLLIYPPAWLASHAPYFAMRKKISGESRLRFQIVTGSVACLLLLAATFRLLQAFKTMR